MKIKWGIVSTARIARTQFITFMKFADNTIAKTESSIDMANRDEYEIIGTKGIIKVPHAFRPDKVGGVGTVIVKKKMKFVKKDLVEIYTV